ncbi:MULTISPECIES: 2OG-Fe(II) oxygenase [Paraburkholderia]|jgi:prolyl 4-hydroxylase|uniref:2-oxoglutarate-dependent dioxygenase n=1 Tax=Paraburkholderia hospita TaxID=169430 RepID=A0AAN1JEQ3_9BURK|nr:2OG-Fe(II) oxygenase [Paraburkholderia hospita]AUT71522.1 2-oxoglutarate-dependent dioxygenase [Paraburkholderia hospita]EIM99476.1 procollagen-proline dioxygenase [Paraburkholderia hospita]OUL67760.1 2-oxoglutarate-dependent dioxygenase [Paraburkholderia hospita]OUL95318.1 2-oxoglutarate-dependent dioxygenase [Paraburkholderia hospita]OUL95738.1 2-oxoglutarate-dependent dioxygenase [Paraburkholderia hospita]
MREMDAAWREWLATNVSRGCTQESMIEAMVQGGFEIDAAREIVRRATSETGAVAAVIASPEDEARAYHYDACPVAAGNTVHAHDRDVTVRIRFERPQVIAFDDVLSGEECAELIERARHRLKRSTTVNPENGSEDVIQLRTSEGFWFQRCEDAFIERLDHRISALMNWPLEHGEGLQILHYRQGGEYRPHFDYFPPGQNGSVLHTARGGQRVATLIVYLSDVEGGGETVFPDAGLAVMARQGGAIYFRYMNGRRQLDPLTLHGGAPVTSGDKWIMTKWMRERPYV